MNSPGFARFFKGAFNGPKGRDPFGCQRQLGYMLKLTFGEPVTGPGSVGASSHFGLGLFVPVALDGVR